MSTETQVCDISLPGYVLTERIGSGGYAEVWRAEAPGGIEKAVKIVYGCYDDEFASQELKALERIKGVRHPFLLSLERFEIVNGRLAILTELADMSLDQRRCQCRADGRPGIPRDELLRYMADAAEALDYLSQRHNLLHLDIKPENLLVSGDHIKVADFGLVKELATRTQNSLVSGMTPTYAAPEMFDDDPSAHSDQYSLAIVYQEMLTGALPFPGRTAAQLAKQHTQAEPQLLSLPVEDRPVIARALEKQPASRYPSCRAFVEALAHRAETVPAAVPEMPRPIPAPSLPSVPSPDDTKPPSFCTTLRRAPGQALDQLEATVTQPVQRGARVEKMPPVVAAAATEPVVPEETIDIAVPETNVLLSREQPTLYIAIGGVGIQLLCRLRALTAPASAPDDADLAVESIALDTDRDELRDACSNRWGLPLSVDDTLHLPLRLPKSYDNSREILGWLSRRWLYNIPRSLETRGYRPLGRVALVDQFQRVRALIDEKLQQLATVAGSIDGAGEARDTTVRIVLLAGSGGGTGAGMVIDVANAARSLAAARNLPVDVHAFLVCTCFANSSSSPLVAANTYSLLTELNHAAGHGNEGVGEKTAQNNLFESPDPPFDHLYCVPARSRTKGANSVDALDAVAKYLSLDQTPAARAALRSCRLALTPREQTGERRLTLKKLGYASLSDQRSKFVNALAASLAGAIERHWLASDESADWDQLVRDQQQAASEPPSAVPVGDGADENRPAPPPSDVSPLSIRGRFKSFMQLEFASEVTRQIQHQLESRDDRGRPLIQPRDARLIADTARAFIAALSARAKQDVNGPLQRANSNLVHQLVAAGSRRVLSQALGKFDPRQPERFLPADAMDEIIQRECEVMLEERLTHPEFAAEISSLIELDQAAADTLQNATNDFLQCGCERRTLLFVPMVGADTAAIEKLRLARPLAAVIPASVEDVIVVSEESGISPHSLALGLERVFPGIADAARRLHTRIDVEWQNLI